MRKALVALLSAGLTAGLLAGCGSGGDTKFTGITHAPYRVSATPLTDTDGSPYSLTKDTTKPLTLVFFGYTHCPDICPMVMSNVASAMTRLDDADRKKVDVVFVTTDPARDTQAVLRGYLDHYDPAFIGLTGDLKTIVDIAKPLAVYVADGSKLPSGGYDLNTHSTQVSAIGSDDTSTVLWDMDTSSAQFAADIQAILHGKAPKES
ncbi:SCO family protein [Nocardioides sp. CER19]|uniref:SCO family protein n=1 Tax=Nocardioides sp. CER19 TaxID=3038538 RepID=UPI0024470ADE|nr:SCO family protein [Nocardioides sp. CER19]MDH2416655.1 SCO family protein [Nocardioides sp. CER19]